MTDKEKLEAAMKLHRPKPTGRDEYVLGVNGEIRGVEPTYVCSIVCEPTRYFAGDGCETWKALTGVEG